MRRLWLLPPKKMKKQSCGAAASCRWSRHDETCSTPSSPSPPGAPHTRDFSTLCLKSALQSYPPLPRVARKEKHGALTRSVPVGMRRKRKRKEISVPVPRELFFLFLVRFMLPRQNPRAKLPPPPPPPPPLALPSSQQAPTPLQHSVLVPS